MAKRIACFLALLLNPVWSKYLVIKTSANIINIDLAGVNQDGYFVPKIPTTKAPVKTTTSVSSSTPFSLEIKPMAFIQESVADVRRPPKCDVLPKCHSFMLALKQFPSKSERLANACRQITPQLRFWAPKFFNGECVDPFQPASKVMMPSYIMLTGALQANVKYQDLILHCSAAREFHFHDLSRLDQRQVQDLLRPCQTKANRISWVTLGLAVLILVLILLILMCLLCTIPKRGKKKKPIGYTWTCELRSAEPESHMEQDIMLGDQSPQETAPTTTFQTFTS